MLLIKRDWLCMYLSSIFTTQFLLCFSHYVSIIYTPTYIYRIIILFIMLSFISIAYHCPYFDFVFPLSRNCVR